MLYGIAMRWTISRAVQHKHAYCHPRVCESGANTRSICDVVTIYFSHRGSRVASKY